MATLLLVRKRVMFTILVVSIVLSLLSVMVVSAEVYPVSSFDELNSPERSYVAQALSSATGGLPFFSGFISDAGFVKLVRAVSGKLDVIGNLYSGFAYGEGVAAFYGVVLPFGIIALAVLLSSLLANFEPGRIVQVVFVEGDRRYARGVIGACFLASVVIGLASSAAVRLLPVGLAGLVVSMVALVLFYYELAAGLALMWVKARYSSVAVGLGGLLVSMLYVYAARLKGVERFLGLLIGLRRPGWGLDILLWVLVDLLLSALLYRVVVEAEKL